jgi:tRNA-2-methylthio-N6-dimethylallyladenosine synthase
MLRHMKYYLWVLGCAMNYSDAERIATVLDLLGYEKTDKELDADIIITVACSVRQHAIDRIYGALKKWERMKRKKPLIIGLSGCVLPLDKKKMGKAFDFIFEIQDLGKLPELLKAKKTTQNYDPSDYLSIMPAYDSKISAYIPIMTGCNNFCSYCAVPYTRGREKSRPAGEIIKEIRNLVSIGYKEITLLGQNVNSYKYGFAELLLKIDKIEGEYRVYFYSNHPKDMGKDLIDVVSKLKHFPHYIHLPLQSGSDKILKKMNRHYTKKEYLGLVEDIRKKIPSVVLTTDIMVGFPGEGASDLAETIDVMRKAKFDMAFLAGYSPRPETASAKMPDDVTRNEKIERERILTEILAKTAGENNKGLNGKTIRVLIDGTKNGKIYGRSDGYKVVEIKTDQKGLLGQFVMVKIKSSTAWKLIGTIT